MTFRNILLVVGSRDQDASIDTSLSVRLNDVTANDTSGANASSKDPVAPVGTLTSWTDVGEMLPNVTHDR